MKQKIMVDSKYIYKDKSPAEILELEKAELEELRKKPLSELTYEEMGRKRRLLFRKNIKSEMLKDHVDVIFNSTNFEFKPSTFTEAFFYSDEKSHDTINTDLEHHLRKSFMLTFDIEKMKQKYIIRK